jgi:Arc/MetJ-type ribon-helix-helix transcriptional regulator
MTLNIQLPDELSRFVQDQIAKRGYQDASAYFRAVIEADQHRKLREELEESLVNSMKGPSTPLTAADFEEILREGTEILERRRAE